MKVAVPSDVVGILFFLAFLVVENSFADSQLADRSCRALKTGYYSDGQSEDIEFYCSLPRRTRDILPSQYWLRSDQYQNRFLKLRPVQPQAPRTVGQNSEHSDEVVSEILNDSNICQFYSAISPSVQSGRVTEGKRLFIVQDSQDLLEKCTELSRQIQRDEIHACSSVEFAGHSTQSVGLDTIVGIDYFRGKKSYVANPMELRMIGQCLKRVLAPKGKVVFSTCGGERSDRDIYHYWENKMAAQKELSLIWNLNIISPLGPVRFSGHNGPNGVATVGGWFETSGNQ